jgi:hypothetical protein
MHQRTVVLDEPDHCRSFLDNSHNMSHNIRNGNRTAQYSPPGSWIYKPGGAWGGAGIRIPSHEEIDTKVRACNESRALLQRYISNQLLLRGQKKFDFRVFLLVASFDPFLVFYRVGFMKVVAERYRPPSVERGLQMANTRYHLSDTIPDIVGSGTWAYDTSTAPEEVKDRMRDHWRPLEDLENEPTVPKGFVKGVLKEQIKAAMMVSGLSSAITAEIPAFLTYACHLLRCAWYPKTRSRSMQQSVRVQSRSGGSGDLGQSASCCCRQISCWTRTCGYI